MDTRSALTAPPTSRWRREGRQRAVPPNPRGGAVYVVSYVNTAGETASALRRTRPGVTAMTGALPTSRLDVDVDVTPRPAARGRS